MKILANRTTLSRFFMLLSAVTLAASMLLDIIRGKTFELGPKQLAGIVIGLAFLAIAVLLRSNRSHSVWQLSLFLLPLVPFYIWIILNYLSLDLWFDEVYTLDHFVIRPLHDTLTDYHSTNNHIFFNIINNFYLRLRGIHTLRAAFEHVVAIRLLMLVYTSATAYFVFLTMKKHFNQTTSVTALIILATTIPFYNYAVQIRGYMLSMLLLTMMVYFLWKLEEKPGYGPAAAVFILSTLLLYTMPPNIYTLAGIFLFYLADGSMRATKHFRNERDNGEKYPLSKQKVVDVFRRSPPFIIMASIALAAIPVFLVYLPVLDQLINNPNAYIGLFNFSILYPLTTAVLKAFLSWRWLLLPLMAAGLWYIARITQVSNGTSATDRHRLTFLVSVLFLPFLLAFIHGYIAFDRVFIVLVPVFAMTAAIFCDGFYRLLPRFPAKQLLFLSLLALYCYTTFAFGLAERDEHVLADIREGRISQDLIYNVYQAHYEPQEIFQFYIDHYQLNTIPLFVYDWGDISAIPLYASYMDLTPQKVEKSSEIVSEAYHESHVITAYPNIFLADTQKDSPSLQCRRLNPDLSYINLFDCTW